MQIDDTPAPLVPTRDGMLFLSGFATSLRVERRHLVVRTGAGAHIRTGRFSKVSRPKLRRVVVHGIGGGSVSFQALAWLDGIGASLVHLSWDGEVVATSARAGLDDPALRRAQARAIDSPVGVAISKHLIGEKLAGQLSLVERKLATGSDDADEIQRCLVALESAETHAQIRLVESRAAVAYWSSWSRVPVRFGKASLRAIPEHWSRFGSRTSPLSSGPRRAAGPANAMTNYLYAIGEAEARIALCAVGLDSGLGILHADQRSRDSLALDLLETIRPQVDEYVFDQLAARTFSHKDFVELPNGNCRLTCSIVAALAETGPAWAAAIAPYAEHVARVLGKASRPARETATPLTQRNRSEGRSAIRVPASRPKNARVVRLPDACHSCGIVFEGASRDRELCDECLLDHRREQAARFAAAGQASMRRRVQSGDDPSHGPEARTKLGRANSRRVAEAADWHREHPEPADPEAFRREILPGIRDVTLSKLRAATGLSNAYCSQVRRGLSVPHARHWEALRGVGA